MVNSQQTGRQKDGRFAPGNPGGPGNPHAHKVGGLRKAMLEAFTNEDLREIIGQLITMAKSGDLGAVKLLFSYTLGQPGAAVDPDNLELDSIKLANKIRNACEPSYAWNF